MTQPLSRFVRGGPVSDPRAEDRFNSIEQTLNVLVDKHNADLKPKPQADEKKTPKQVEQLSYTPQIDSASTGVSELLTIQNGAVFSEAQIDVFSASGIATGPTLSIGTNSPTYDNLVASTALATLLTADDSASLKPSGVVAKLNGGVTVFVNITVAAAGGTQQINIGILGKQD